MNADPLKIRTFLKIRGELSRPHEVCAHGCELSVALGAGKSRNFDTAIARTAARGVAVDPDRCHGHSLSRAPGVCTGQAGESTLVIHAAHDCLAGFAEREGVFRFLGVAEAFASFCVVRVDARPDRPVPVRGDVVSTDAV